MADPSSRETCDACAHRWSTHDALSVRYCTATMASAQSRGCICVPTPSTAGRR